MASIYGVSAKKIVEYKGHEGETCRQCDIYIDGKKTGFYAEDTWGGPERLDFTKEQMALLKERTVFYFAKYPEKNECLHTPEMMIFELLYLCEKEKIFKKAAKAGFRAIGFTHDGNKTLVYKLPAPWSDKDILSAFEDNNIEERDRFMSLDDFIIK